MNRDRDFLLDMVDLIEKIEKYRPPLKAAFLDNEVLQTAAIHWIQTIGEAANAMSQGIRNRCPEVPWRQVGPDNSYSL